MLIELLEHPINLIQDKTKDTYDLNMGFIKSKVRWRLGLY